MSYAGYWPEGSRPARDNQDSWTEDEPKLVIPKHFLTVRVYDTPLPKLKPITNLMSADELKRKLT